MVSLEEPAGLLRRAGKQDAQILQGRDLETDFVKASHLLRELVACQGVRRLLEGDRQVACEGGQKVDLVLGKFPRGPREDAQDSESVPAGLDRERELGCLRPPG